MKRKKLFKQLPILGLVLALGILLIDLAGDVSAQEPLGTAFTYQGRLFESGSPANGPFDFEFKLFDAPTGGSQLNGTNPIEDVTVIDGIFIVELDFGSNFTGDGRWLEIGVRPGSDTGAFTPLTPRQELTPTPYALALPGLRTEPNTTSPNVIGGFRLNSVTPGVVAAAIGGGGRTFGSPGDFSNRVTDNFGTVGGGENNQAGNGNGIVNDAALATVGGGVGNTASGSGGATIGGGSNNTASGQAATIGGGVSNVVSGAVATISGGQENTVTDNYGTISGGMDNQAGNANTDLTDATYNTVGGGKNNIADGGSTILGGGFTTISGGDGNTASGGGSTIGGGRGNAISADGVQATIGGGFGNTANNTQATISGGHSNVVSGTQATIGGGFENVASSNWATIPGGNRNTVTDDYGNVGGGGNNRTGDNAGTTDDTIYNTIGGGYNNIASGEYPTNVVERGFATVSGGRGNEASGIDAAIGGGKENIASGESATVGGGLGNKANGFRATIGGGLWNEARSYIVTIAGGYGNIAGSEATMDGWLATVGGGYYNTASGNNSTIGGGFLNTASFTDTTISGGRENEASGESATVPGGFDNVAAGDYSFAAGRHAEALHDGSFVWADSTDAPFASTAENQFLVRANGGAVFTGTVTHGSMLDVTNLSRMYSYGIYGRGGTIGVVGASRGTGVSGDGGTGVSGYSAFTDGIGVSATARNGVALYARSDSGNPIEAYGSDISDREFYVSNGGDVYADGTFNPGGADFAEMLPAVDDLEPGDVLAVGSDGKLTRSIQAYQPTVVGVYSTQPGFLGGAGEDADLTGKIPLAVLGVVPVKASVENGAIRPGDLLIASSTPGHAMKTGPNPPAGTILGKALEGLDKGTGVIQMLVMLQ